MTSADRPQLLDSQRAVETELKDTYPTIRAHHLRFIGWAMGFGAVGRNTGTPESVAHWFTQKVETWLKSNDPYERGYAEGTVGLHKERSQEYEYNLGAGLRDFSGASDEKIFTIVEQVPDTIICAKMINCGLGDHCPRRRAQLPNGSWGLLDETGDTDVFIHVATKFLGMRLEIEEAMAISDDAPPQNVRKVTVTAGDIRRVLTEIQKADKLFSNNNEGFFRDIYEEEA